MLLKDRGLALRDMAFSKTAAGKPYIASHHNKLALEALNNEEFHAVDAH